MFEITVADRSNICRAQAAVTKMRNDAVVVPLRQQAPSNASGDSAQVPSNSKAAAAATRGSTNPLTSVDPDLADAAATGAGIAGERKKKGTAEGKPGGALGEGGTPPAPVAGLGGQGEARGAPGLPVDEAFRNASVSGVRSDSAVKKRKVRHWAVESFLNIDNSGPVCVCVLYRQTWQFTFFLMAELLRLTVQAKRGKGVSSGLNWFGQVTDGDAGRPAPPAAQRKRSLFLDTMQFMPQVCALRSSVIVLPAVLTFGSVVLSIDQSLCQERRTSSHLISPVNIQIDCT